jgi:hypothetical protein
MTPPRPRLPTTSRSAPLAAFSSTSAGGPSPTSWRTCTCDVAPTTSASVSDSIFLASPSTSRSAATTDSP